MYKNKKTATKYVQAKQQQHPFLKIYCWFRLAESRERENVRKEDKREIYSIQSVNFYIHYFYLFFSWLLLFFFLFLFCFFRVSLRFAFQPSFGYLLLFLFGNWTVLEINMIFPSFSLTLIVLLTSFLYFPIWCFSFFSPSHSSSNIICNSLTHSTLAAYSRETNA